MSNSIRLVLPISIVVWEMIFMYFQFRSSCSCIQASFGKSTSEIDLRGDLVMDSSCRLAPSSISGNKFALLHCTWFQLTSWISSTSLPVPVLPKENTWKYYKNYCLYWVLGYLNIVVFCGWIYGGCLVE